MSQRLVGGLEEGDKCSVAFITFDLNEHQDWWPQVQTCAPVVRCSGLFENYVFRILRASFSPRC